MRLAAAFRPLRTMALRWVIVGVRCVERIALLRSAGSGRGVGCSARGGGLCLRVRLPVLGQEADEGEVHHGERDEPGLVVVDREPRILRTGRYRPPWSALRSRVVAHVVVERGSQDWDVVLRDWGWAAVMVTRLLPAVVQVVGGGTEGDQGGGEIRGFPCLLEGPGQCVGSGSSRAGQGRWGRRSCSTGCRGLLGMVLPLALCRNVGCVRRLTFGRLVLSYRLERHIVREVRKGYGGER